jgi:hypothetical protein
LVVVDDVECRVVAAYMLGLCSFRVAGSHLGEFWIVGLRGDPEQKIKIYDIMREVFS